MSEKKLENIVPEEKGQENINEALETEKKSIVTQVASLEKDITGLSPKEEAKLAEMMAEYKYSNVTKFLEVLIAGGLVAGAVFLGMEEASAREGVSLGVNLETAHTLYITMLATAAITLAGASTMVIEIIRDKFPNSGFLKYDIDNVTGMWKGERSKTPSSYRYKKE